MKKAYVDDTNRARIVCTKCGFGRDVDTTGFKGSQKKLKGTCRCGEAYLYTIEFRQRHRKDVMLPGEYLIQGKGEKGEILIRDLSMSGFRFETMRPHHISKGDTLEVKFNLNNPLRTEIQKSANVVRVQDRIIGAYFTETKLYEKDLGFYLQS